MTLTNTARRIRSTNFRRTWKMSVPGIQEYRDQNYTEALPLLTQSALSGDAEAQCMLGNLYQLGLGDTPINETQAMRCYYHAANQGHSVATNNLAGMVWPISREAAAALYQLANEQSGKPNDPAREKQQTTTVIRAKQPTALTA
jgi:hypothetical protein